MKALLAVVCGFVLTLAVFFSGLAVATSFLTAKPVRQTGLSLDAAQLWTAEPRTVNATAQDFKRLPARPVPVGQNTSSPRTAVTGAEMSNTASGSVDTTVATSSIQPASEQQQMAAAHMEWCANRYRSYQPRDNSYTPYGGGRRPCISPYSDAGAGGRLPAPSEVDSFEDAGDPSPLQYVSGDAAMGAEDMGAEVSSGHVRDCFSRYRSYRPQDNTYQPYAGGPRRQCR